MGDGDYGTRSNIAEPYSCLQVWVFHFTNEIKIDFQQEIELFEQEMELFFQIPGLLSKHLF